MLCKRKSPVIVSSLLGAAAVLLPLAAQATPRYDLESLVTDDAAFLASQGFPAANFVDPNLKNPWGVSFAPTGPFWVSNQFTGTATLYNGEGEPFPIGSPLVVNIPAVPPPAGPTGQVFNGSGSFTLADGTPGLFFFANLDGSISGWNFASGTTAEVVVPGGTHTAVYTGLATGSSGGADFLYAANNQTGAIDVYDTNFNPVALAGDFTDPGANPEGLHPFNIQRIGDKLYVTYAVPGPEADEAALGSGFVSVFNLDGTFVTRIAEGGELSSPWGVTIAPDGFGDFGGALLIGNFSDEFGFINAFDPGTGAFLGQLLDVNGDVLNIPYLWALLFGNGGLGGDPDDLYFTAGIGDELHGLFAELSPVPEPAVLGLFGLGLAGLAAARRRRRI